MADDAHHEIVIIRRGGHGDHDDHHGGAWKVAFADFMTALMAFFLVMWLISANDKTKAVIAKYFNPVRLVDATVQPKGLHDQKAGERGTAKPDGSKKAEEVKDATEAKAESGAKETAAAKNERLDEEMRSNPLAALAEIASTKGKGAVEKPASRPAAPVIGRRGGDAFRDPFAPPPPPSGTLSEDDPDLAPAEKPLDVAAAETPQPEAPAGERRKEVASRAAEKPAKAEETKANAARKADDARKEGEARAMLTALESAAKDVGGPQIDVQRTSEGLVVSLTDTETFTMFGNGSAVPDKRVLTMMEKVAEVLGKRKGAVIIRGFTDSKQYKSHRYDNWHLSLDRAQAAHYMLIRGGFDDARIERIEGRADRGAKPGVDPSSPLNRRIEILVRDVAS